LKTKPHERRNHAFDAAAFAPAAIQTDKPADELEPAFLRFLFATYRKSNSTRLGLQYSIFGDSILRCPEGIEYSRHRAVSIPGIKAEPFRAGWVSRWSNGCCPVASNRIIVMGSGHE
jgi:hypothetical protein